MRKTARLALGAIGLVALGSTLSSCGRHDKRPVASRPAPAQTPRPVALQPAVVPIFAPPETVEEAVWRLRAGLNVAALSCRGPGRQPVAVDYGRMLARHRALLDLSYRQEQGRQGTAIFDRQQTRLYNRFANQWSPERFCHAAVNVAQEANGLSSPGLVHEAPRLLARLEAPLWQRF